MEGSNEPSSMVSPENSEDGRHPPVAERSHPAALGAAVATSASAYRPQQLPAVASSNAAIPLAPALTLAQQTQPQFYHQPLPGTTGMVHLQHEDPSTTKRRRVDVPNPMLAVANGLVPAPGNAVLFNGALAHPGQPSQQQPPQPLPMEAAAAQAAASAVARAPSGGGRKKSQTQIDRRRERNRILARRTRLRKKFFFESLQKELMDLQRENFVLKEVVKENLVEDEAQRILADCDAMEKLPPSVLEACGQNGELSAEDFNLVTSIQKSQHSFVITDPSLPDNPIVFVSDDFLKVTGYARDQILGRNCRFLQGTETSKEKIAAMRQAVEHGEDMSVTLLNYTATGKPFWNKLFIAALRDAESNVVNFIGVIVPVVAPEPNDPEHAKAMAMKEAADMMDDSDDDDDDEDVETTLKSIEGAVSAAVQAAAAGAS